MIGDHCPHMVIRVEGQRSVRDGFTLIELAVVVVIIGVLAAIALPNYTKIKDKAREAEVKAGLHSIQTTLERFGVDNAGGYPNYLIGGEPLALIYEILPEGEIIPEYIEASRDLVSDPLIRLGYTEAYPRNPFIRTPQAVHATQRYVGDPLRNSFADGQQMGTRFGAGCNLMGQVLCEPRYLTRVYNDYETNQQYNINTWCNIQYDFYDAWLGNLKSPYIPGVFMYKSMGEIAPSPGKQSTQVSDQVPGMAGESVSVPNENRGNATVPLETNQYVLAAWGGPRTKGLDILGEEPMVIFSLKRNGRTSSDRYQVIFAPNGEATRYREFDPKDSYQLLGVPPWTRGVSRTHVGPLWGSPFGPSKRREEQLATENPNGIRDALILVLTAGSD